MTLPIDSGDGDAKRPRGQFGIGRLMVLTTVVAVIMTIAVRINAPQVAQGLLVGYLLFFAFWAVIRGPSIYADLTDINKRRRQIKQRRSDLERELEVRKKYRQTDAP
jgi:hypothetical protein